MSADRPETAQLNATTLVRQEAIKQPQHVEAVVLHESIASGC
jgi:hypothetical protein